MKKFLLSLLILVSALSVFSCSSLSGPEKVAMQAMKAIQNKDYDAYAATFDLPSSDQKILAGMAEDKAEKELEDKGGIKSFKITDSKEEGDTASVTVLVQYKDGSEDTEKLSFVKKDGKWLQEMTK